MATIGDVLRHLLAHAPTQGEDNRAAFLEAVNAEYPPPEPPAAPPAEDPQAARIAELEAELAAAKAGAPPGG
jgi:hypothetical protein